MKAVSKLFRGVLILSAMVASGCASVQQPVQQTEQNEIYAATLPDGSIRIDTEDERVAKLWSASEQARIEDNNEEALELLFQALEISPQNSLLWSRAAEMQLENNQAALAESYADKSNVFAASNTPLLHRNWLIIEHARSMRGDLLGVRSAHKKVQEYQYSR